MYAQRMSERIAVLGAGSWGTALAKLLADAGHEVWLWGRAEDDCEGIDRDRENKQYLPGFRFPDALRATSDIGQALDGGTTMIVSVIPSHGVRSVLSKYGAMFPRVPIVSASKGIENESLMLVSEIFEELLPASHHAGLTYLSGPSFAKEVAARMPTAVSIAGHDAEAVGRAQAAFATDRFRVYTTDDVVGVEIGGALKNVIAIATGIVDGLGFGSNTRAAVITRGLAEISRLAIKRGAHPMTLAGLAGMGDLVLTCTGDLSRNRSVGIELGKGRTLSDVLAGMTMVAEGVKTTQSARDLALRENVEMPIVDAVYGVLYEGGSPVEAMKRLMSRDPRRERDE
jgi:glycerol-3-phosphate dehydrogenase (NAD(P)+)